MGNCCRSIKGHFCLFSLDHCWSRNSTNHQSEMFSISEQCSYTNNHEEFKLIYEWEEDEIEADFLNEKKRIEIVAEAYTWRYKLTSDPESIKTYINACNTPFISSQLGTKQTMDTDDSRTICWKRGICLGKGTFGTVWCGITDTEELIAVKQIEITSDYTDLESDYKHIFDEVTLLRSLQHANIVSYIGLSYNDDVISIFMQYVPGNNLTTVLEQCGPLAEAVIAKYTRQLLQALCYLHSHGVLHRDIKSANIMLTPDGTIKLIDFGCAKRLETKLGQIGSNLQKSMKGTTYWMAPEVITKSGYGKSADIWSLGCTIYEMCTGKPPWGNFEPYAALFAIGSNRPHQPLPDSCSSELRDFVSLCLARDKKSRPSAAELLDHEFLKLSID